MKERKKEKKKKERKKESFKKKRKKEGEKERKRERKREKTRKEKMRKKFRPVCFSVLSRIFFVEVRFLDRIKNVRFSVGFSVKIKYKKLWTPAYLYVINIFLLYACHKS
jgi:hypothetical protein